MIEPTETESRETLDAFVAAMRAIAEEARTDPAAVKAALAPFLPLPAVVKEGEAYRLVTDGRERPQSVGRLREFWGNFAMFVRAWALVRE